MIADWLIREQKKNLILFCNGWGMDSRPLQPLTSSEYDILVCYDYSTTADKPDLFALSQNYEKMILVCWSIGVVYGQNIVGEDAHLFEKTIAVNGTLNPLHDDYGIPLDIFRSTLQGFNTKTLEKFYRRMCRPLSIFDRFMANRPERTLASQKEELKIIFSERLDLPVKKSIYSHIVVSHKDLIVPTKNQLRFWQDSKVTRINGAHFPFYMWESWDNFINYF